MRWITNRPPALHGLMARKCSSAPKYFGDGEIIARQGYDPFDCFAVTDKNRMIHAPQRPPHARLQAAGRRR